MDMTVQSGIFCVEDLCDNTTNTLASSIMKSKGNIILPRNETLKKCDETVFHNFPKDCSQVRKTFTANHIINITGNVGALNFKNCVHNSSIRKSTSTINLLNDFDYEGCSDDDDSDEEIEHGHGSSEELNDQDITAGLNETAAIIEDNMPKKENQYIA